MKKILFVWFLFTGCNVNTNAISDTPIIDYTPTFNTTVEIHS